MAASENLYAMFRTSAACYRKPDALASRRDGAWRTISHDELVERVRNLSAGLHGMGIGKGDGIALYCESRPEWTITDLATLDALELLSLTEDEFRERFRHTPLARPKRAQTIATSPSSRSSPAKPRWGSGNVDNRGRGPDDQQSQPPPSHRSGERPMLRSISLAVFLAASCFVAVAVARPGEAASRANLLCPVRGARSW